MSERKEGEPLLLYADRKAREIADKAFGPGTLTSNQTGWWHLYWSCMSGYGFYPYVPGMRII